MASPPSRLRPARPADLNAIDRIEGVSFSGDRFPRRNLARLLKSASAGAVVAEATGETVGYVLLLYRKGAKAARLYSLAVAPDARGSGTALALVSAAEKEARKKGCARLRLEVRESNMAARRLYERAGFALLNRKTGYYQDGETALQMEKRLDMRAEASP